MYWSAAMRRAGYESHTYVLTHYFINRREDYDRYLDEFQREGALGQLLAPYRFFAASLRAGDVFLRFFDGGFLRHTPLQWTENRLLKLAGKRLVVVPYGSDVAVNGHFAGLEDTLYADYPALRELSDEIKRWADHMAESADLVVRNWQVGYIPRYDLLWVNMLTIDLDRWADSGEASERTGHEDPVKVVHTPNHRNIKGTPHLLRAVEELREDGLKIDLELVEGRPNEEVRSAMAAADIVADQFLLPGYAMAAVEAMAAGKPVLVNIGGMAEELRATEAVRQCPAVDTNPERLKEDLRRLIENPDLRREAGRAGRDFVERFHSYEVNARTWEAIIAQVWRGTPPPASLLPAPR
jgi:Glycosyl transferases group 1